MKNWQSEINDDLYFPMLWYELFAEWVCSSYTEIIPQKLSGIISSYNYIFNASFLFLDAVLNMTGATPPQVASF